MIRLGPGPTLLGTPDTGLDDATFDRFVRETFSPETARGIPGLGNTDPDRFAVRSRYLAGVGRMPWLTWRSRAIASLYAELAEAAQAAAPVPYWPWSRPAWTTVRPVPRRGGSIGPDWPPARRGAASGSISKPGRAAPGAPPVLRGVVALDRCAGARPGHQPRPRRAGRRPGHNGACS